MIYLDIGRRVRPGCPASRGSSRAAWWRHLPRTRSTGGETKYKTLWDALC